MKKFFLYVSTDGQVSLAFNKCKKKQIESKQKNLLKKSNFFLESSVIAPNVSLRTYISVVFQLKNW